MDLQPTGAEMAAQAFGRRLRAAMRDWEKAHDQDLTQERLAEMVGRAAGRDPFAQSTVRDWIRGEAVPKDLETMLALAAVVRVRPGELFFGERDVVPSEEGATLLSQDEAKRRMLERAATEQPRTASGKRRLRPGRAS